MLEKIENIPLKKHVLIAGPTASGKSALALAIAREQGGVIVNADALQVWDCWRILSARPNEAEEAQAEHRLYGHLPCGADYSVGHWLREVAAILDEGKRLIVVGGTGLYLSALTEGLAEIPPIPSEVRAEADKLVATGGLDRMIATLDPDTNARIDLRNPARVQRAWEVQRATGRGIAAWQADTGPALIPLKGATAIRIECDRDWLADRIDRRFLTMVEDGALEEAKAALPRWDPSAPWAKAIGAPELIAHLRGELSLPQAIEAAQAASRQYAKRQRTWLRSRMGGWTPLNPT
ncbi:tRNA (adenosine(37)-N6)-dimethylallyltransferase MiaA [Defluviimonas sp. WL0002]|uniref:tRNA dimethylallyltransferase n=1 Tax=Albidovulum marisflavi TaxID=2984159 RepID=A0ABT2ZG49_9RHOB|nr:tRNA (adenosine(37)-N6)-dimethylallyltransferase MiaA [Defluviimonas sp. WL0002]MCV2870086.1 tRNA (adenosine(37)-N6)-dimethylallyltransferase MiaA [Defluviimonas sp. WL0002]